MAKKILLGLTTLSQGAWRNKIREIDELGLKEIALFLTGLDSAERKELYQLLEKTKLQKIPHVHLRNDMELSEVDYLINRFTIEVFNVHPENSFHNFSVDYGKYAKNIYVENLDKNLPSENDLKKYAGLCLDLSHWQATVLIKGDQSEKNLAILSLAKNCKIGINHVSAIKPQPVIFYDRFLKCDFNNYDSHWLDELSEVDYIKNYKNYLAEIISLELENPLKRQLEVKGYLEKILDL